MKIIKPGIVTVTEGEILISGFTFGENGTGIDAINWAIDALIGARDIGVKGISVNGMIVNRKS